MKLSIFFSQILGDFRPPEGVCVLLDLIQYNLFNLLFLIFIAKKSSWKGIATSALVHKHTTFCQSIFKNCIPACVFLFLQSLLVMENIVLNYFIFKYYFNARHIENLISYFLMLLVLGETISLHWAKIC